MSTENQAQENKMGVMPENRLLLTMAIPIVISMLVQALYNVVDSVFVAQLSEDALNAVSLAFPVQNLMIAVAVGTGVGINALLSKSLGEGNQAKADRTAMNGLFLSALSFLVFAVIGLTCSRLYFTIQTDIQRIVDYGESYMMICCVCSFGVFFQITLERTLQATGRTLYTMFTQATGAIINIILDPIMIFGLFGFPRMEVAGAALATVTGQIVAAILGLFFNLKKNPDLHLSVRGFRPSRTIIGGIYSVGIPSIVMQSIGSVMVFGMNQILIAFTQTATAVFGVYFKLQSFIFMPVFGLNNGMVPIVAYNYGARKPARIMKTIRLSVCYAVGIAHLPVCLPRAAAALPVRGECLRRFAAHRSAGTAYHFLQLFVCRLLYRGHCRIPGTGARRAQSGGLCCPAAFRTASSGFPALQGRRAGLGLVGLPHRGAGGGSPVYGVPETCVSQGDRPSSRRTGGRLSRGESRGSAPLFSENKNSP